ncbi:MAG: tRNA (guanosine(46)-N7)-methyltransferase TrmB [Pirellulaceae bacterium]
MGRRALRKIDPSLDLSHHFLEWDDLPNPLTALTMFGHSTPFEVEVGSGKGLFLRTVSPAHPERVFLGIEVARKYARFSAARLAKHEQANAKVVCADGLRVLAERIPDESLAAVHVYFPDPWWKKRHKKRRVLNASFLADVQRVLQNDGRLEFWTDVREYFDSTNDLVRSTTALVGPHTIDERAAEHDLDYRTHFERRTRLNSQPVYRARFCKTRIGLEH